MKLSGEGSQGYLVVGIRSLGEDVKLFVTLRASWKGRIRLARTRTIPELSESP